MKNKFTNKTVWCLDSKGNLIFREDWDNSCMVPHGVAVVTNTSAFIIAPHHTIAALLCPDGPGHKIETLEKNTKSLNCYAATGKLVREYKGIKSRWLHSSSKYDYLGAPAAEFCQNYKVDSQDSRDWCLPTVRQLKIIAEHLEEINACFLTMNCPIVIMGTYWSSIIKNTACAWGVNIYDGSICHDYRDNNNYVRAVSVFVNPFKSTHKTQKI